MKSVKLEENLLTYVAKLAIKMLFCYRIKTKKEF